MDRDKWTDKPSKPPRRIKSPWSLLFQVIVRRGILVFLLLVVSIPVAVSCLVGYAAEASRSGFISVETPTGKTYCAATGDGERLAYGVLVYGDRRMEVPVIVMKSSSYRALFGRSIAEDGTSISGYLARRLGITRDETVVVCLPEGCHNTSIVWIHENRGFPTMLVIIVNDTYGGGEPLSLNVSRGCGVTGFEEIFSSGTIYLELAPYLIVAAVLPVIIVGFSRIIDMLQRDLSLLYSLGVPPRSISSALLASLLFSGTLSLLLGLSMGLVASHLGLWLVHVFTGFPYIVLPVPDTLLFMTIPYLCIIIVLSIYYSARLGGGLSR